MGLNLLFITFMLLPLKVWPHKCIRFSNKVNHPYCKNIQDCERTYECNNPEDSCFSLLKYDIEKQEFTHVISGCSESVVLESKACDHRSSKEHLTEDCVLGLLDHKKEISLECCCIGDSCNQNLNFSMVNYTKLSGLKPQTTSLTKTDDHFQKQRNGNTVHILIITLTIAIPIASILVIYLLYKHIKLDRTDSVSSDSLLSKQPLFHKQKHIYQGQFTQVWKGYYEEHDVAIKLFASPVGAKCWTTEKDIYSILNIQHQNILTLVHAGETHEDRPYHHNLVTQYIEYGSLYDYLRTVPMLSFESITRLMTSMLQGVAYLHQNLLNKPMIAHRDLKSQNVMVRKNGSCCIGDFGLAVAFHDDNGKSLSLAKTQVGSKIYMSPEILQGAIAYYADAFLHSDMYSVALILWEILSRTNQTPYEPYQLPYERNVGRNPSISEMRHLVAEQSVRPYLKAEWRQDEKLVTLCDTIENCWDSDTDARLSADCCLMRIKSVADEFSFPDNENIVGILCNEKKRDDMRLDMTGATSSGVSSMGNDESQSTG
ncbi:activin receptor type-2A-like [Clytia hemisphaerica]|uniref:Serine/threonine-protein kinase receptor n=1 Tax=Clytia hemisphaerica TaxID=252671 RepID=A0A7M5WRU0_9CNID